MAAVSRCPVTSPGDILTPDEVAAILRVEPATLRTWRYRRKGPPWFVLDSGAVRYDRDTFEAWLKRQREVTSPSHREAS